MNEMLVCRRCLRPMNECTCDRNIEEAGEADEEPSEVASAAKRILGGALKGALGQGAKEIDRILGNEEPQQQADPPPQATRSPPGTHGAKELILCGKCNTAYPKDKFADHYAECTGQDIHKNEK